MIATAVHRGVPDEDLAGRILCHDVRGPRNELVFRKGHLLRASDLPALADAAWTELHLLELGPGDFGQREAGERLAASLSSEGLAASPSGHRHILKALHAGLVKIDVAALQRLNSIPGIAIYTLHDDQVAAKDQLVAEAQITSLAIDRGSIEAADGAGVIRLLPFVPRETVVWMRDDRRLGALSEKLRGFGCDVREVLELPRDAETIRESLEGAAGTLFLVSGSNALDPLDPVFAALQSLGATMQRIGMPVHPGTLLWIAAWRGVTIIGLPTCGLGTQVTAFDRVLPKILAEGRVSDDYLAALGHGGILSLAR